MRRQFLERVAVERRSESPAMVTLWLDWFPLYQATPRKIVERRLSSRASWRAAIDSLASGLKL
jgi:hypothetical protein